MTVSDEAVFEKYLEAFTICVWAVSFLLREARESVRSLNASYGENWPE